MSEIVQAFPTDHPSPAGPGPKRPDTEAALGTHARVNDLMSPPVGVYRPTDTVAETTEQAREEALKGAIGRDFDEYFLRNARKQPGRMGMYKQDPDMADDDITLEYLLDTTWIVGDRRSSSTSSSMPWAEMGWPSAADL